VDGCRQGFYLLTSAVCLIGHISAVVVTITDPTVRYTASVVASKLTWRAGRRRSCKRSTTSHYSTVALVSPVVWLDWFLYSWLLLVDSKPVTLTTPTERWLVLIHVILDDNVINTYRTAMQRTRLERYTYIVRQKKSLGMRACNGRTCI